MWSRFNKRMACGSYPPIFTRCDSFRDFIEAEAPEGLGATVVQLERLVTDDPDAVLALRNALKAPHGGTRESKTAISRLGQQGSDSLPRTLDRLHRNRPDLYERVKAGELSANAAAIEAGWKRRMASIPVDSPESAIKALERRFTRQQLIDALGSA
jgi:hypothetical protein